LDWLISKDIVKPNLSDCISSSDMGYEISDGAIGVAFSPDELPYDLIPNGLEIVTKRQIFHPGEYGIDEIICPNCQKNIAFENWNLDPWQKNESDNLICPICGFETDIQNYTFDPVWGFSDLGFVFWNWSDFTDEFIDEFKNKLNCDISIINQRF
jgi:hypothetical protein